MTWMELVREYFPKATDGDVDFILWELTGFPAFWGIPQNGNTPEECCRKQLRAIQDSFARYA